MAAALPLPPRKSGAAEPCVVSDDGAGSGAVCPITHAPFRCPVILETGVTYEKEAIQQWLLSNRMCPVTRRSLNMVTILTPNRMAAGEVYGDSEIFFTGPLTSTEVTSILPWLERSPSLLTGLATRLRLKPGLSMWRLADGATIFPKLATLVPDSPEALEVLETLFESMLTTLTSSMLAVVAMRILSDTCLLVGGPEARDVFHRLGAAVLEKSQLLP